MSSVRSVLRKRYPKRMEAHSSEIQFTLEALAIMTAIPVVIFALWADYFGRYLENLAEQEEEIERAAKIGQIRMAGFLVAIFQIGLFLGSGEVRRNHPVLANLIFISAILIQGWMQARLERKVDPVPTGERGPQLKSALRGLGWIALGALFYAGVFVFSVKCFTWFAAWIQADKTVSAALIVVGAILGIVGGLALNFALGPIHLKMALPVSPLPEQFVQRFREAFARAGLRQPSLWLIESGRVQTGTAFIAGTKWGNGPLRPALFISRNALETLTLGEIDAVVLHEASHLCMNHLVKRLLLSITLITGTMFLGVFVLLLAPLLLPSGVGFQSLLGPFMAVVAFVSAFRILAVQSREHEVAADLYAVERLGASYEDLSNALRKLDRLNGFAPDRNGVTHPATETRLALLKAALLIRSDEFRQKLAAEQADPDKTDKAA